MLQMWAKSGWGKIVSRYLFSMASPVMSQHMSTLWLLSKRSSSMSRLWQASSYLSRRSCSWGLPHARFSKFTQHFFYFKTWLERSDQVQWGELSSILPLELYSASEISQLWQRKPEMDMSSSQMPVLWWFSSARIPMHQMPSRFSCSTRVCSGGNVFPWRWSSPVP